jgi:hypothetical protein
MFIGHYAVALAAKRAAPSVSLGALCLASAFLDLAWPLLQVAGLERLRIDPSIRGLTPLVFEHYPYSHSLLMATLWALLLGGGHFAATRHLRGAAVIASAVVSHWLLDALVHRPDLPLAPGGTVRVGLGLWNAPVAAAIVELGLFAGGLLMYLRATRGRRRGPLWAWSALLLAIFAGSVFGPPPPSVDAVVWSALAQGLLVAAAVWVDRAPAPATSPMPRAG